MAARARGILAHHRGRQHATSAQGIHCSPVRSFPTVQPRPHPPTHPTNNTGSTLPRCQPVHEKGLHDALSVVEHPVGGGQGLHWVALRRPAAAGRQAGEGVFAAGSSRATAHAHTYAAVRRDTNKAGKASCSGWGRGLPAPPPPPSPPPTHPHTLVHTKRPSPASPPDPQRCRQGSGVGWGGVSLEAGVECLRQEVEKRVDEHRAQVLPEKHSAVANLRGWTDCKFPRARQRQRRAAGSTRRAGGLRLRTAGAPQPLLQPQAPRGWCTPAKVLRASHWRLPHAPPAGPGP